MRDYGGMVFFDLVWDIFEDVIWVLSGMKVFILVELLGGVEFLIGYLVFMMYVLIFKLECLKVGLIDLLICLSVGVEDVDDLIVDLEEVLVNL